jgi:hypothetical protein
MSSIIKVNTVQDQDGNNIINENADTITVGASGDTVAVAGNVVKTNAVQASDGGNLVSQSGTTITLGASGDTISLASGASQTGFGRTGTVDWQSTVKTATFTAVSGEGYFCNTTSSAFTVNLPAGSAGAIVSLKDYADTFDSNNLTVAANGSEKIGGSTDDVNLSVEGIAITLIYIDSTRGWLVTNSGLQSEASQPISAEFLLIAGGGSGGVHNGAGAGAGGLRTSFGSTSGGGASAESNLTLTSGTQYTITIGGGAAAVTSDTSPGVQGSNSQISGSGLTTVTCIGGGAAGGAEASTGGGNGGSGGGGGDYSNGAAGSGTSGQGFAGGAGNSAQDLGGGGGAGAVGQAGSDGNYGGAGGAGLQVNIDTNNYYWAGGGGGAAYESGDAAGAGGIGGGGGGSGGNGASGGAGGGSAKNSGGAGNSVGSSGDTAGSGGANTGSGGGGKSRGPSGASGAGGSGIFILRLASSNYTGTVTGSPAVTTSGSDTIITFTGDGTYTA